MKSKAKPIQGKSRIGAIVRYCGHDATFVADVIQVGTACVVIANGDVSDGEVDEVMRGSWTRQVIVGYWNPRKGVFVVPSDQLKLVRTK